MSFPTWLIPLIIMSGVIAYAGDVLGKNLGKKRLSIFGLRPKQTAHLFSIGSGVLILVVTLALILVSSKNARDGLLHLKEIQSNLRFSKKEQSVLTALNKQLSTEVKSKEQTLQELTVKHDQVQAARDDAERELTEVARALESKKRELRIAQAAVRDAKHERDKASMKLIGTDRVLAELGNKVKQRESEVRRLQGEMDNLLFAAGELQRSLVDVLIVENPIIYNRGQIILSRPLDTTKSSAPEIRQQIMELLNEAAQEATRLGAAGLDGRAVFLPTMKELDDRNRTEEQQIDDAVTRILNYKNAPPDGFDGRVIVDLVAIRNALRGREVHAGLVSYPNERVFRRGEEIARITLEGGATRGVIFSKLQQLIENGRRAAESRKLRPRDESVYDEAIKELVFSCMDKVNQASGRVTVKLLADRETRSADSLRVRFETAPAEGA